MNYHMDYQHVSKTMLGHFCRSPYDYQRYYVTQDEAPPEPKRVMVVGSAIHAILLERKKPDDCIRIYPKECFKSNGTLNPKPAAAFREENADYFVMKAEDAGIVRAACDAAHKHPLGEVLRNDDAIFEQAYRWLDEKSGLRCRMQADISVDMGDHILAYDLKTTGDIYPSGVRRTSKRFRYWLQDAHYSAGLESVYGKPVKFVFWFLEAEHPHRIARWEYTPAARQDAMKARDQILDRLATCYETDDWSDEWTKSTNLLSLDPWEVGADEEGEVVYAGDE